MATFPTISVVMATYNGAAYLAEQLDSILAQTCQASEIIIQDDGSNDDTMDIAKEYAMRHPQIKLYYNEENVGFNRNFITAFARATGDYIAISDQDDIWFPQKLERQVAELERTGASLAYSFCYKGPRPTDRDPRWLSSHHPPFGQLVFCNRVYGHTIVMKRSLLDHITDWGEDYIVYDWRLVLEASFRDGAVCVEEYLNWHRPHEKSVITIHRKKYMRHSEKASWQPYILGIADFYMLQRKKAFKWLYRLIRQNTAHTPSMRLEHEIAARMLSRNPASLLKLCMLCLKNREQICPEYMGGTGRKALLNSLRAFSYPFIRAYFQSDFDF